MATLGDANALSVPIGSMAPIGRDELGQPVYRNALSGATYMLTQPQPQGDGWSWGAMMNALASPYRLAMGRGSPQDAATVQGAAAGLTQGLTAPGRAAMGEPVTLGDVWSTALDYGLAGAPMTAPEGALRNMALRSEAMTPAQTVADMLRTGRGAEVTDAIMAQVDPQEMWRLYESGATGVDMPMDQASRMARASDMGFDTGTPLYHGTGADFQAFDMGRAGTGPITNNPIASHGVFTAPKVGYTDVYGDTKMPLFAADGPYRTVDMFSTRNGMMDNRGVMQPDLVANAVNESKAAGDLGMSLGSRGFEWERMIYDPRNLRSMFARFDPRLAHLGNLSAAAAGYAFLPSSNQQ